MFHKVDATLRYSPAHRGRQSFPRAFRVRLCNSETEREYKVHKKLERVEAVSYVGQAAKANFNRVGVVRETAQFNQRRRNSNAEAVHSRYYVSAQLADGPSQSS